jgi:hypothetical protein
MVILRAFWFVAIVAFVGLWAAPLVQDEPWALPAIMAACRGLGIWLYREAPDATWGVALLLVSIAGSLVGLAVGSFCAYAAFTFGREAIASSEPLKIVMGLFTALWLGFFALGGFLGAAGPIVTWLAKREEERSRNPLSASTKSWSRAQHAADRVICLPDIIDPRGPKAGR